MASPFKAAKVKSLAGILDTRSQPDEVGFGNFTLIKNSSIRSRGKRCRRGGFAKFLDGVNEVYNNEDLHDQLIGMQLYYEPDSSVITIPGGLDGYVYPYFVPTVDTPAHIDTTPVGEVCGYAPEFLGMYDFPPYDGLAIVPGYFVGYPYAMVADDPPYGSCNTGPPSYWLSSFFSVVDASFIDAEFVSGYFYGDPQGVYRDPLTYLYEYCQDYPLYRGGCNEAITHVSSIGDAYGNRHLVAGTKSRLYALNSATGNWKIIADGLGHPPNSSRDCDGCSQERWMSSVVDGLMTLVNGVTPVLHYTPFLEPSGCNLWRAYEDQELLDLGITSAAVVGAWKGFTFLADIVQNGTRRGNIILWSDFGNGDVWIPDDDNVAGNQELGNDETILRVEPLNDYLFIYTDKSIYRAVLITEGGVAGFVFEEVYRGDDALKFKYSLVNTGNEHVFWTKDRLMAMTSFEKAPVEPDWMRSASNGLFDGIDEDDLTFGPINNNACNHLIGGYNPRFKEIWFSWATDDNECPNMSLVFNVTRQEEGADYFDHGFTAFHWWDGKPNQTLYEWLEELQVCPREGLLPDLVKEGFPYTTTSPAFTDPPAYLWNEANDLDQPAGPDSLCERLATQWIDLICSDCPSLERFVMASATDRTLKEYSDRLYYREMLEDGVYVLNGYDTVIQSGLDNFSYEEDKMVKNLTVTYSADVQTVPNALYAFMAYGQQSHCDRWKQLRFYDPSGTLMDSRPLRCLTDKTAGQHDADMTRADLDAHFPTQLRGKFLAYRLKVTGTGGGSCFSRVEAKVSKAEDF